MIESKKIFISYDKNDYSFAQSLFYDLQKQKQVPWLDRKLLLGGKKWEQVIPYVINEQSDFFIMLLSKNSVRNNRYFKKEFELARTKEKTLDTNQTFIIPVKIDETPIPKAIKEYHVIDLTREKDHCLIYDSIGINRISLTHSFLEGCWVGYTIENMTSLNGKPQEVFPCFAKIKIENNLIQGSLDINYLDIGNIKSGKLNFLAYPEKNTLQFDWENPYFKEQKGKTVLNILSETHLSGSFVATGIETEAAQHGITVWHKVQFQL